MATPMTMKEISAPRARVFALSPDGSTTIELVQLTSIEYETLMNDVGQLKLSMALTPQAKGMFVDIHPDTAVPIIVQAGAMETIWFTTHVVEDYDGPAPEISVVAVSPEKFLETLYCWPVPEMAPEFQVVKHVFAAGPIAHIVKERILRQNINRLTVRTLGFSHHRVAPLKKADGYTRSTTIEFKMTQALELCKSLMDPEGITLTCRLYLPGRGQEPPPLHPKNKACLIWDVEQRAQLPDGNLFLQGIGKSIEQFWRDVWNTVSDYTFKGVGASRDAVEYWGKPQLMVRKNQYDSLRVETAKPTGAVYTVGGHSPDWLNKIVAMGVGTLLNMATAGLGVMLNTNAFADVLDDRFFSYHSFTDFARLKRMGSFGFVETFKPSTGLSFDAVMMLKQSQYKTRATKSHEFVLSPSAGLVPGRDFKIGTMAALELPGDRYVVAFVQSIKYSWTTSSAPEITVQVADKPVRDPFDGLMRQFSALASFVNKVALLD